MFEPVRAEERLTLPLGPKIERKLPPKPGLAEQFCPYKARVGATWQPLGVGAAGQTASGLHWGLPDLPGAAPGMSQAPSSSDGWLSGG